MKNTGIFFFLTFSLCAVSAIASTSIPQLTRTRDFSGWTPASRGDILSIGMAGATIAQPASIAAAEVNPAGFAMMAQSISAQINSVSIYDQRIQKNGERIDSRQVGFAVSPPPWGFGFAYYSPMREGGNYFFPASGRNQYTEVGIEEYRFTLARSFFESRLSVGTSFRIMHATRELGTADYGQTSASYNLGVLFRLEDRIIIGASYSPSISIDPSSDNPYQPDLLGFNRTVRMPSQLAVGISWIPNRFFRVGFGLHRSGATENTALLADESKITGASATVEPRLGASYVLAEFFNFNSDVALGTYYETSRIEGEANRLHLTAGLEANPYFVNTGIGIDISKDYRNFMVFVGLNVIKTLRTFDIIPPDPLPPVKKFWPEPFEANPDGLAPGLTEGEETSVEQPSLKEVQKIVADIPKKISEKFSGETPKKKASSKKKRVKK